MELVQPVKVQKQGGEEEVLAKALVKEAQAFAHALSAVILFLTQEVPPALR